MRFRHYLTLVLLLAAAGPGTGTQHRLAQWATTSPLGDRLLSDAGTAVTWSSGQLLLPDGRVSAPTLSFTHAGTPYAEETITVSNRAIGVTAGLCTHSGVITPALVHVNTHAIYFTLHRATATPDSGDDEAAAGTYLKVQRPDRLRMRRSGGSDASVEVTCLTT